MARNASNKGSAGSNRSSGGAPAARKTDVRWSVEVWEELGRVAEERGVSRAGVVKGIVVVALARRALGEGSSGGAPAESGGLGATVPVVGSGADPGTGLPAAPPAAPAASRPLGRGRSSPEEVAAIERLAARAEVHGIAVTLEVAATSLVEAQFGRRLDNGARARRWVVEGRVRVNGRVVRDPDALVDDDMEVEC